MRHFGIARWMITLACLFLCCPSWSNAAVPQTINYQGVITDHATGQLLNGTVDLTFAIYAHDDCENLSGVPLWSELHHAVGVTNGVYSVVLGGATPPTPLTLAFDQPYCLGVAVSGAEVLPRQKLTAVPYALRSATAKGLASATVTAEKIKDGTITPDKLGRFCADGQFMVRSAAGWACGNLP